MAEILVYLMMIAGVNTWEQMNGQVIRINLDEENRVTDMYHAVEDLHATIIPDEQYVTAEGDKNEMVEENSAMDSSQN